MLIRLAIILSLLTTFSICYVDSENPPSLIKVTHKVFFDVSIDGVPAGRIVMGLFGETVPKTVANFRALCTGENGIGKYDKPLHYKGSVLFRIVYGWGIEGGDFIRNNGSRSESIYGKKFADENFKIKHDSYYLSMINRFSNANGSQFLISTRIHRHLMANLSFLEKSLKD